jgi:hypothetical protein
VQQAFTEHPVRRAMDGTNIHAPLVNAPSGYIKDDVLQFNQSFDSIASL